MAEGLKVMGEAPAWRFEWPWMSRKALLPKPMKPWAQAELFLRMLAHKALVEVRCLPPAKTKKATCTSNHQVGTTSTIFSAFGSIENHLNMVVTPDGKVGVTPSSTAKDYPSTEIYKYTVDEKGKITTTLILHKKDSNNIRDLGRKEKPVQADPK